MLPGHKIYIDGQIIDDKNVAKSTSNIVDGTQGSL